jgi:hypothetical protein
MRLIGYKACTRERRDAYNVFGRKPEGKRLLGRLRRGEKDNIKMILKRQGVRV